MQVLLFCLIPSFQRTTRIMQVLFCLVLVVFAQPPPPPQVSPDNYLSCLPVFQIPTQKGVSDYWQISNACGIRVNVTVAQGYVGAEEFISFVLEPYYDPKSHPKSPYKVFIGIQLSLLLLLLVLTTGERPQEIVLPSQVSVGSEILALYQFLVSLLAPSALTAAVCILLHSTDSPFSRNYYKSVEWFDARRNY
jgi:hypothetical protein